MRNLYARFVLWLIRPALDFRNERQSALINKRVSDIILKDLHKNGPIRRALAAAEPLSPQTRPVR